MCQIESRTRLQEKENKEANLSRRPNELRGAGYRAIDRQVFGDIPKPWLIIIMKS